MADRKWTIATVNYLSTDYIRWQAKMLHEFNDDFIFKIIDHSNPHQRDELESIKKEYQNIEVLYPPYVGEGFGAHGIGLSILLKLSSSKYFLSNDPDFFWIVKGHLKWLEGYLAAGIHCVGAQNVPNKILFPNIWGAAYITEEIRGCNFQAKSSYCNKCKDWVYDPNYDTGFELTIRLKHLPFKVFTEAPSDIPFMGSHSYAFDPKSYSNEGKMVGHHLMRGAYLAKDFVTPKMSAARQKYGEYFYNLMAAADDYQR
jgi:hypothetical protein